VAYVVSDLIETSMKLTHLIRQRAPERLASVGKALRREFITLFGGAII